MIEFVLITTWLFFADGTDQVFNTKFPIEQESNCRALLSSVLTATREQEPNAVVLSQCSTVRISEEAQERFWSKGTES